MIDETEKKIRKSEEAEKLLKNKLLVAAFTEIRDQCYRDIENSKGSDKEAREDAYYLLKAIRKLEGEFVKTIRAGKDAKGKLEGQTQLKRIIR